MNFMHCRNFRTRNDDHLIIIKTGNAHEKILPQTIIDIFKKCEGGKIEIQTKVMMVAQ